MVQKVLSCHLRLLDGLSEVRVRLLADWCHNLLAALLAAGHSHAVGVHVRVLPAIVLHV